MISLLVLSYSSHAPALITPGAVVSAAPNFDSGS